MTLAGIILGGILLVVLLFYSYIMLTNWFRQGYREASLAQQVVIPKIAPEHFKQNDVSPKGYKFEQFIVSKFSRKYFKLSQWRSDKYVGGVYPASNCDPDLVMEYRNHTEKIRFAVECKWRSGFKNGFIDWAKEYQIRNYYAFQNKEAIPVFIIIGIGGKEEEPEELFIVPLPHIEDKHTYLHFDFLRHYRRFDIGKMFFLDLNDMLLK